MLATYNVLNTFVPTTAMKFVTHVDSPHLVPGIDPYLCWWEEWGGPDNCTYDGAGEALHWIYGSDALSGSRENNTKSLFQYLYSFDQNSYIPDGPNKELFAAEGRVFVPPSCLHKDGVGCALHVFLHGCGVASTYDVFTKYGGFNEWAYNNHIVVLYPQVRGSNLSFPSTTAVLDVISVLKAVHTWHMWTQFLLLARCCNIDGIWVMDFAYGTHGLAVSLSAMCTFSNVPHPFALCRLTTIVFCVGESLFTIGHVFHCLPLWD